uniref:replication helicase subunit n=1 Tax=Ahnfeltia fastigiata TaxID=31363 RepID=UPI001D12320A|nr:replication helicase subunit [Ahnfeltia fastigiata]UAT97531.1 replication helicase subunit [Ahnfeltia fastigiata]
MRNQYVYYHFLPPQNYLAEEIIIGSILINESHLLLISQIVTTETFFWECHKIIYRSLLELYKKKISISALKILYTLWNKKKLKQIGGISKITSLIKQSQSFISKKAHLEEYAKIIYYHYIQRLIIQYGYHIIQLGYTNKLSTDYLHNTALNYLNSLLEMTQKKNSDKLETLIGDLLVKITNEEKHTINSTPKTTSGFYDFDKLTNGLTNGDLIVIAGRPSMGKTSFAMNIAKHILNTLNLGVCIFSLEMSKLQILHKIISIASHIPVENLISGQINKKEWCLVQNICNRLLISDLCINDTPNISIDDLDYKAKIIKKELKTIQIIIIDYLQLIQVENISHKNRTQELGYITRTLKLLARELEVPVIILSQLNRNIETRINKRPMLSDLRESGCIGPDTKIDRKYYKDQNLKFNSELIISDFSGKFSTDINRYQAKIIKSLKQYVYTHIINKIKFIQLTHNHKILTATKWKKQDQIYQEHLAIEYKKYKTKRNILEFSPINNIQLIQKSNVYDLQMHDYLNFLTNNIIIHNSIEQDADIVLMLYRDDPYQKNNNSPKLLDIIISKHRNGPIGAFQLLFDPLNTVFSNIEHAKIYNGLN